MRVLFLIVSLLISSSVISQVIINVDESLDYSSKISIAQQLEKLINNYQKGDTDIILYFPKKRYILNEKLLINCSNVKLLGDKGTILDFINKPNVKNENFIYYNGGIEFSKHLTNISVENIYIKGYTNDKTLVYGLKFDDFTKNIIVKNCVLDGFTGGILFNNLNSDIKVCENLFKNMTYIPFLEAGGYGIVYQSSIGTLTEKNIFENTIYRHSVYYSLNQKYKETYGEQHIFNNNIVYGSLQDNYLTGNEFSLKIMSNRNLIIENNKFIGGIGHVWITQDYFLIKDVLIKNNLFELINISKLSKSYAIGMDGNSSIENLNIINNTFKNNIVSDLIKIETGKRILIEGNKIDNLRSKYFFNVIYKIEDLKLKDNIFSND